ncbi:MAG: hypothetical protein IRD7MM_05200 [Candidatus Midichloria mitochondrii]
MLALARLERYAAQNPSCKLGKVIQTLHALVISGGCTRIEPPPPHRDGQNVIKRASSTGTLGIVDQRK